jgi:hypothetical protein
MTSLAGAILPHDLINMAASDAAVCGVWHIQKTKLFAILWNDHEKECIKGSGGEPERHDRKYQSLRAIGCIFLGGYCGVLRAKTSTVNKKYPNVHR